LFHCTPHPGLGTVVVKQVQVDLATCMTSKATPPAPSGAAVRGNAIVFKGKVVVTVPRSQGPVELEGVSGDGKWVLYAVDPMGSASIAADGLQLQAASVATGRTYPVAFGLNYASYRTWCDFRTLVVTAGGDRIAVHAKRLVVTGPPSWKARPLVRDAAISFGSVVCAPDGNAVVVQAQQNSVDANFFDTHWSLYRVGLTGGMTRLTTPPKGYADESPQFSPDQSTLYFVRSRKGVGKLYALRNGKVVGPLLSLGSSLGYYGHQDWPYTVKQ
jgi:WD40-like Beta Propeller Repeat